MKFLRFFGLFALVLGFAFNGAFAASTGDWYTFVLNDDGGTGGYVYGNSKYGMLKYGVEWGYNTVDLDDDDSRGFIKLDEIANIPTSPDAHHSFGGYYTGQNKTGVQITNSSGDFLYTDEALTSITANNTPVYAYWAPKHYRIILNDNGGSGGQADDPNNSGHGLFERYGSCYIFAPILNNTGWDAFRCATRIYQTPTRTGYDFAGYTQNQNGSGERIINANGSINTDKNTVFTTQSTIYAQWTPKILTVTLNHQSPTNSPAPSTVYLKYATDWYSNSGATTTINSMTTKPLKTNYDFGGYWTGTNGSGTQVIDENGNFIRTQAALTAVSSNATIYAKWTVAAPTYYMIVLNKGAGTSGGGNIYYSNQRYYCDNGLNTEIGTNDNIFNKCNYVTRPILEGSDFTGFYSAQSGGTEYIDENGKLTSAARQLTLSAPTTWYAQYEATCDSMITLDMAGGTLPNGCDSELRPVLNGTNWEFPTISSNCIPTRDGYTFAGYTYNGTLVYNNILSKMLTTYDYCNIDKLVLTAQWDGKCNAITFNDNNDTSQSVNQNAHKSTGDSAWKDVYCKNTITPSLSQPTNDHATFLGYYTKRPQGQGTQIIGANGTATNDGNNWTVSGPETLYAHWQCDTNYVWNETTQACEQNTASVTYKCYAGDSGKIDNEVTLTNYAVRSLSWYSACNINTNNPVPDYKWRFSGTNTDYRAGEIISNWTYGNGATFVPSYTATFNCDTEYWQTPTGGSAPATQSAVLGDRIIMPNMPCAIKSEYDGWLETNYTWETSYTQNLTSPVPNANCNTSSGDLHFASGDRFDWVCPTDLTFEPLVKFVRKPITVSCGQGGTSQTFEMTYENQSSVEQDIIDWYNTACTGSCPLSNPTGYPSGYNRKVVCATDWGTQTLPTEWDQIENDTQGRTCYKTPAGTTVQNVFDAIDVAQITDLAISNVTYCPQRVTYKCSSDATDVYDDAPYAVFEREYTTLTPEVVGCESGLAFSNWKNPSDNRTFTAGEQVSEWPYDEEVTLVAQWGDANTYQITYELNGGTNASSGMPTTYTYGVGATINGVPTREHSTFAGWCTDSTLNNCATVQTISSTETGDKTFWAKWECEHPYHIDPDTGLCVACISDEYWDGEHCQRCGEGDAAGFPHSTTPFNWSIDQCWRDCENNAPCEISTDTISGQCRYFAQFRSGSNPIQIELRGNVRTGINTCDATNVSYCPVGIMCFVASNSTMHQIIGTADVDFNKGNNTLGQRSVWGIVEVNNTTGQKSMSTPLAWTAINGPAQTHVVDGSDFSFFSIAYPSNAAPDATRPGMTFIGYKNPDSVLGTQYVGQDYELNQSNADSVVTGIGNSAIPYGRTVYAQYTSNEYTVTYKCGNSTGTTQNDTATYGENYIVQNNTGYTNCENPGYTFLGWVFSGDNNTYNEGYVFRPWNHIGDATFTAKWNTTGNEYTITYKPNYDGAAEPDVTQRVTYGGTFTTKPAGTFHRPGYEMSGWGGDPVTQPVTPYPLLNHEYTYLDAADVNLFAQWEMCAAGTYAGETESQCTNCPDEYPLSTAGATAIAECYRNCSVNCTPVDCPANSTCTQSNETYSGTEYYGGTCNAVAQNCDILTTTCYANYYLDGTICEPCPDGMTSPAGSTSVNQCVPVLCDDGQYLNNITCEDCPNGYPHSDPNATSQSQCYYDCETPCTEPECPANATSCTYGTNPNSGAWYFGTDACNATPLICPIESVTCADGYGLNPTNNTCEPCTGNEASINNSCEPCPDGYQPNEDHTECVPCPDGTAGTNGTCEPCEPGYIPNQAGTACEPCEAGTYWENGVCEPCPEDYSSAPGSVGLDACFLAACPAGQHLVHGACEDNVIDCDAPHAAIATRTWNPGLGAYGSCQIQSCEDGYHVASNACVPDEQLCNVANGRGEREWNGTQWGNCVVTECDPGFTPNANNTACGRCDNYMGADGQPAVSSYVTDCEIATCMYQGQKYALENGECMPICNKPDDETGHMEWNESTKKCVRTCNPGYKMW